MSIFSCSGRRQSDPQAVVTMEIIDDGLIHLVAADADRLTRHLVAEAEKPRPRSCRRRCRRPSWRPARPRADRRRWRPPSLAQPERTCLAPARRVLLKTARFSTGVMHPGHSDQHTRGLRPKPAECALRRKIPQHRLALSEIGDHARPRKGRTTEMASGVRPSICRARCPTAQPPDRIRRVAR